MKEYNVKDELLGLSKYLSSYAESIDKYIPVISCEEENVQMFQEILSDIISEIMDLQNLIIGIINAEVQELELSNLNTESLK